MMRLARAGYRRLAARYPRVVSLRVNRLMFGNARPLRTNLRFQVYLWTCRRAARRERLAAIDPALSARVAQLRRDGFCVVPPVADDPVSAAVAARVSELVEAGQVKVTPGIEEWMIQVCDVARHVPEVVQLLRPDIVRVLEGFYRSRFKIFCMETYRLVPTSDAPAVSGLWHTDNYPPGMMKAMVYLTDCTRGTGALRVHPWPRTRQLRRRGFYDRYRAQQFLAELEETGVPLEGRAGTVILWDSNLVHRATPPVSGTRDAVAFKFMPSPEPWESHLGRMGDRLSYEYRPQVPDDPADD